MKSARHASLIFLLTLFCNGCASKLTLVHIWAPWCVTCEPELEELNELQRRHPSLVEVRSIASWDEASDIEAYLSRKEYLFSTVSDPTGTIATSYGVTEIPTTKIYKGDEQALVYDPVTNKRTHTVIGVRSWSSHAMLESLRKAAE